MIRTALVGYGRIAARHVNDIAFFNESEALHAPGDPTVKLVACCDIQQEALDRFVADTGVDAVYPDVLEMLDREKPDYIHVATRADIHRAAVQAAAQRGIHVLCEKPMAMDCAECDEMNATSDGAGIQLVLSHQRRSDPLHWYAQRLVADGLIGELRYITGGAKPRRGGQELHNNGCHLIDAIGIFAGEPAWVSAHCSTNGHPSTLADRELGDRDCGWVLGDRVDITIGYGSGVQAHLQFSEDPSEFHWILSGTQGRLALFEHLLWHCPNPFPSPTDSWTQLVPPSEPVATTSGYVNPGDWTAIRAQRGIYPRVFMMRELYQRMDTGGQHTSNGHVGAIPIEVMQAAFTSHLTSAKVTLPLAQRLSPLE